MANPNSQGTSFLESGHMGGGGGWEKNSQVRPL